MVDFLEEEDDEVNSHERLWEAEKGDRSMALV